MSKTKVDEYLQKIEPSKRRELQRIRKLAKKAVPDAEEALVYGMPTLKFQGKPFLGFDAHRNHIGIYPYSGEVITGLKDQLKGYGLSKGAIRVPFDEPMPGRTLKQVISARLKAIKKTPRGDDGAIDRSTRQRRPQAARCALIFRQPL